MDSYKITKQEVEEMARECHSYNLCANGSVDEFSMKSMIGDTIAEKIVEWLDGLDLADVLQELEQEDREVEEDANEIAKAREGCY